MLAAIAEGRSTIHGFSTAADCASTLACLREVGVQATVTQDAVAIEGRGLKGLTSPKNVLDAGNSGSTIRMLTGILAGQDFRCTITGDDSLRRRPMSRILHPLRRMGAEITAREDNFAPLLIQGRPLQAITYKLPVHSAQVKTAALFAGLLADGETTIQEELSTRDHTEIALLEFDADVAVGYKSTTVRGGRPLKARDLRVPGDISSAAFLIVAALLFPESNLALLNVGLNPTRAKLLDLLRKWGADIRISNVESVNGELIGDVHVSGGPVEGGPIGPQLVPELIDELPVLAVLGAFTTSGITISGAQELRIKESDRIASVAQNLRHMGVEAKERPDGLDIAGGYRRLQAARLDSFGDHRIAMAFSVAALAADGECVIEGSDAAQVSFPGFYEILASLAER